MLETLPTETLPTGRLVRRGAALVRHEVALYPRPFFFAVLAAAVFGVATVASSYVVGRVVDQVVVVRFEEGSVGTAAAVLGALAILGVALIRGLAIVFRRTNATIAQTTIDTIMRAKVVDKYQRLPFAYHRSKPTGELMAHASADCEAATEVLAPLPFSTGVVVLLVVAGAWMVVTDAYLAALGFLVLPGVIILNAVYQRKMEGPAVAAQERVGDVSAVAHESFDGALVIKALGAEAAEASRFGAMAERLREAKVELASQRATLDALLDALPLMGVVGLIVVGAWRIDSGAITLGTMISFVSLFTVLTWPLRMIGYVLSDLPRAVAGFDRVQEVLAEVAPPESKGRLHLPAGPIGLEVEGLQYSYDGTTPALSDVSFRLAPGSTVAVVGPTGSGKSTLVLVLATLLRPTGGTVRLGGVDVAELALGELPAACSVVFQESFLFADSLEENVLMGHDASQGELRNALVLAGVEDFIDDLPAGLATVVGERGATVSGGQRQRIALARALVRKPLLLMLDDATSAVDPSTEARILTGLGRHLDQTTTVVVANRPSTLALADSVLYMEEGRLAGAGTHDELLATLPGYEELVRAYETARVGP